MDFHVTTECNILGAEDEKWGGMAMPPHSSAKI